MNEAEVRDVLRAYDLGRLHETEPLDCDPRRPWRVSTAGGEYVLRECRSNGSPADLAFEHGLADWLADGGLPVSRAVVTREGQTWVEKGGRFFALHPYSPGEPFRAGDARQAEAAGACLARFHEVASQYSGARDRKPQPAYRTAQVDAHTLCSRWPHREEVKCLVQDFERLEDELTSYSLSEALLCNDFSTGNVVFEGRRVPGIFDLECCHWGPRLRDLANSILWFGLVEAAEDDAVVTVYRFDLSCARALLQGYAGGHPLPGPELGLLPLALRRQIRRWALFDQVDAQGPGRWRADEWQFSRKQIGLVDASAHLLADGR